MSYVYIICIHAYIYNSLSLSLSLYIYIYDDDVYMHTHMCVRVCMCMCMFVCVSVRKRTFSKLPCIACVHVDNNRTLGFPEFSPSGASGPGAGGAGAGVGGADGAGGGGIDCGGCQEWSREQVADKMAETEARMRRLEGDMNRRPQENAERWREFARVKRLLHHLRHFNRAQMRVWHGYALGNYSAAKVWVEALFDPPLQINISRVDRELTAEWARLKHKLWLLDANMNNTEATHGRFRWIFSTLDALLEDTAGANRTWVRRVWVLHDRSLLQCQ